MCRYKKNPRMDIHKRENLDIAFRFLTHVEKVPIVNIGKYDGGREGREEGAEGGEGVRGELRRGAEEGEGVRGEGE